MSERDSYLPGTPSWIDLGTSDVDGAAAFYRNLFGWDIPDAAPDTGDYRMCILRGRPVAGLGPQQNPNQPPWWTTYVSVHSADETAAAIVADGGTILVPPMDVMEFGRMAVAADPCGATFSIWQAGTHIGAGLVNEPGALCWNELTTRHPVELVGFYEAVFDWQPVRSDGPMPYTEFQLHGQSVGGMMEMGDQFPLDMPDNWTVYFAVADCDESAAKVTELGGTLIMPPTDIPPGRFAVCKDPQGAVFQILALTQEM